MSTAEAPIMSTETEAPAQEHTQTPETAPQKEVAQESAIPQPVTQPETTAPQPSEQPTMANPLPTEPAAHETGEERRPSAAGQPVASRSRSRSPPPAANRKPYRPTSGGRYPDEADNDYAKRRRSRSPPRPAARHDRAPYGRRRSRSRSQERRHDYLPGRNGVPARGHLEEFRVPASMVGLIIGRGGEQLKRIERDSGGRVGISQVDIPGPIPERSVTVEGSKDVIAAAKAIIQEIMDGSREAQQAAKMRSGGVPQYNVQTVTHMVPASRIGLCIGKGGETVRILQERSGAKIIVTPDRDTDLSAPDRPIAITGSPEMIAMARQLIDELVYSDPPTGGAGGFGRRPPGPPGPGAFYPPPPPQQQQPYSAPGAAPMLPSAAAELDGSAFDIDIPNEMAGGLIGRGGETVKQLQHQSGARIFIDMPNSANRTRAVHIRGTPPVVNKAKELIDIKLEEWEVRNNKQGLGPRLSQYQFSPGASTQNNPHLSSDGPSGTKEARGYYDAPAPYAAPYGGAQPYPPAAPYGGYPGPAAAPPPAPPSNVQQAYGDYYNSYYQQQQRSAAAPAYPPAAGGTASPATGAGLDPATLNALTAALSAAKQTGPSSAGGAPGQPDLSQLYQGYYAPK